jgi:hypothetical protein
MQDAVCRGLFAWVRRTNSRTRLVELLREIAFAHALLYAVSQTKDGGRAQTSGCGADPVRDDRWRGWCHRPFRRTGNGRRFTASLARGHPTHDTRFDPRAAYYRTQSVWGQTLARLSSATFRLFGVQASSTGRFSLSQTSRAEAIQPFRPSREGITRLGSGSQWLVQVVLHAAQNCALRFGALQPSDRIWKLIGRRIMLRLATAIWGDQADKLALP